MKWTTMPRLSTPHRDGKRTAIFTIISNNYAPYARTLVKSSLAVHEDSDHFICVVDKKVNSDRFYPDDCHILEISDLDIPGFEDFAFRYDILELNTATKPFMFLHLFNLGYDRVIYFDPDIKVYRAIDAVHAAMDSGAKAVLTPHLTQPSETLTPPNDIAIMRAGVYNLGFAAFQRDDDALDLLRWWARRLRYQCVNAQDDGIFVDQKFMDLVPGFMSDVAILRDTSCNIAYWNLNQRELSLDGDGGWLVDDEPITFFHFSGFNPKNPKKLSKFTDNFSNIEEQPLKRLIDDYLNDLSENGYFQNYPAYYHYGYFKSGNKIPDAARRYFRDSFLTWDGDPFENFEAHLAQPTPGAADAADGKMCTNLMYACWRESDYLRSVHDLKTSAGVAALTEWFIRHSHRSGVDQRLTYESAERIGTARRHRQDKIVPPAQSDRPDLSIVGYLTTNSGVGEVARITLQTLADGGRWVEGLDVDFNVSSSRDNMQALRFLQPRANGRVNIFNINADQLSLVARAYDDRLAKDAYRIAVPFWELAHFPEPWLAAFNYVDEVWAPSRFIQAALVTRLDKPVIHMPIALDFDVPREAPASGLLPKSRFIFLFCFDFLSFKSRKNPEGTIAAFNAAFRGTSYADHVSLVIKCVNAHHKPRELAQLQNAIEGDLDIRIIDKELTRPQMLGLIEAVDCVVSLHRSEGLGLLVAESMALGTPVIATDYSATTELLSADTGYPVEYQLKKVEAGEYPFAEGQIWAEPDIAHAALRMRQAVEQDSGEMTARAKMKILATHGRAAVTRAQARRLNELGL